MQPGGLVSQAPGNTRDFIRHFKISRAGARSALIEFQTLPEYDARHYGIILNGTLARPVIYVGPNEFVKVVRPIDANQDGVHGYVEDFGGWPDVDDSQVPITAAQTEEGIITDKLSFKWTQPATFSQANGYIGATPRGDTQLTAISVTGMRRFANVESVGYSTTRARLSYRITQSGADNTVSWYKNEELVAEGTITGDGSVTCTEQNDSGLEVTCTLTYTGDVAADTAYIQLIWPESYQIHYSTSALSFPASPQATVNDNGDSEFQYVTAAISAGTYNAAIVPVRDGKAQATGIPETTGLVINTVPSAPTDLAASGTAASCTLSWTNNDSGVTFNVYYSLMDKPINFGSFALPASITTGADATSQALAAITGYPGYVRALVRAVKGGVEEKNGEELVIEFDSTGAIVAARPNRASINDITTDGLEVTVDVVILSDESDVAASTIELFIKDVGTPLDFTSPEATASLSAAVAGIQRKSISYTVLTNDKTYHLAVRAKSAAGELSIGYAVKYIALSSDDPSAAADVGGISIKAIRGAQA